MCNMNKDKKRVSMLLSKEVLEMVDEMRKEMNHNTRTATVIEIICRYYKEVFKIKKL